MTELKNIIEAMNQARTMEELKKVYREAVKTYHPDSNNGKEIEAFLTISEAYERNEQKLSVRTHFTEWRKEAKRKATNSTNMISRHWDSIAEFLSASGEEQLAVLKAMVKSVSRRLWNASPKANSKQITDKHKADSNGNMDGMRTYVFAKYCYNSNHTFNEERVEEVAHSAYIKLAENMYSGKYDGEQVSTILWISCRQALYNTWYNEAKTASFLDRQHDIFDLNAYQTTAPIDWTTEATAVTRVYLDSMDTEQIISLAQRGYSNREIADMIGTYPKKVDRLMTEYKARLDADRIRNAMIEEHEPEKARKNQTAVSMRKSLIMKAISNGMSYKRIAYHIGIADITDKKTGTVVCSITEQIRALLAA